MSYFIYKIVCEDLPEYIYVGSTKAFRNRKAQHKFETNNDRKNTILYKTIRDNGGWENWRMVCIEECDETIDSKRKVEAREEEYRIKLKANLNSNRCYLTEEQYKEYDKERYKKNKEKINEQHKEYNKANKERIKEYREANKEKIKKYYEEYTQEYYQKNKEKIKEKNKIYREANKEKLKEYYQKKKNNII